MNKLYLKCRRVLVAVSSMFLLMWHLGQGDDMLFYFGLFLLIAMVFEVEK